MKIFHSNKNQYIKNNNFKNNQNYIFGNSEKKKILSKFYFEKFKLKVYKIFSNINSYSIYFICGFFLLIPNIVSIFGMIDLYNSYFGLFFLCLLLFIGTSVSIIAGLKHLIGKIKNNKIKTIKNLRDYFFNGTITNDFIYLIFITYFLSFFGLGIIGILIIVFAIFFYYGTKFEITVLKKTPNILNIILSSFVFLSLGLFFLISYIYSLFIKNPLILKKKIKGNLLLSFEKLSEKKASNNYYEIDFNK